MKVTPDRAIWPFLVRHAAFLMGRFNRKTSGRTPFQTVYDESYGDDCWPNQCCTEIRKADSLWTRGIWLGRTESTQEHLVCIVGGEGHSGIVTSRTVRRLTSEKRCDKELSEKLTGAPWQPHGLMRGGREKRAKPVVVTVEELAPETDASGVTPGMPSGSAPSGTLTPTLVPQRNLEPGEVVGDLLPAMNDEVEAEQLEQCRPLL
eukprot:211639-Amphidinium_carterae.5